MPSYNNLGPRTALAGGFQLIDGATTLDDKDIRRAFSTTTVSGGFASDTYLAGSAITFPSVSAVPTGTYARPPVAGCTYHLRFDMVKTAAGTATPILVLRFGTAGTTADAAICTFTFGAGTAAVDTGMFELWAHFRTVGSGTSAVVVGVAKLEHALAATGLTTTGTGGSAQFSAVSSGFNSTVANSIIGASFNGGASFSGTCSLVEAEMRNLSI